MQILDNHSKCFRNEGRNVKNNVLHLFVFNNIKGYEYVHIILEVSN